MIKIEKTYISVLDFVEVVHDITVAVRHYIIVFVQLLQIDVGRDFLEHRTA